MSGQKMFNSFSGYNSVFSVIYYYIIGCFSYVYLLVLVSILSLFLLYRIPYCYSIYFFIAFLVAVVFSSFVCFFCGRLFSGVNEFFSSFVPLGTPLSICPLVCVAETVSYVIRPIVLILRPFINISLGCIGTVAVCNMCFGSWGWVTVIFLLFFYELFVAVVHWYIVTSILAFSVDH